MEQVIGDLYVGNDAEYQRLKSKPGYSFLRCCKEGPDGHRETLGYKTQGAPQGPSYLAAAKGDRHMALNFIDPHDPAFIQAEMLVRGLAFIGKRLAAGDKVLVACNAGHSRGPTTAMLYLRATGGLPGNFQTAERVFRVLCPQYTPGIGMRQFARSHWNEFEKGTPDGRI